MTQRKENICGINECPCGCAKCGQCSLFRKYQKCKSKEAKYKEAAERILEEMKMCRGEDADE